MPRHKLPPGPGRYKRGSTVDLDAPQRFNPTLHRARLVEAAERREAAAQGNGDAADADSAAPVRSIDDILTDRPRQNWAATRCKVCSSPHRAEVDKMGAQHKSLEQIATWLKDQGLVLSRESVRRHLRDHVDVAELVASKLAKDEAQIVEEVDADTSDLDRLNSMIERLTRLEKQLSRFVSQCVTAGQTPPMSVTNDHEAVINGLRQAIQLRQKLLEGTPADDVDKLLAALWSANDDDEPVKPAPRAVSAAQA